MLGLGGAQFNITKISLKEAYFLFSSLIRTVHIN